jgi:multidrug efflux pump subunit AcrB
VAAYTGLEAARLRWGADEVRVRVLLDRRHRGDPERFLGLRVPGTGGQQVALGSIAELDTASGLARVARRDQSRVITVSGDVDTRVITSAAVNRLLAEWTPEIVREHPGVEVRLAGENEDTARSLRAMQYASLLAVFLIYTILAVLFNSFAQPLIVMSVIPFGIVGVVGGLLFQGMPMGLMSIMGTIALAGIVVNNSVVFVDFINQFRKENPLEREGDTGLAHYRFDRWFSIYRAGSVRLRPIFLTSITTVAGLWSLAFMTSGQEEFLAPMAQALVWGLTFATLITLLLVPCLYAILDDWNQWRLVRRAKAAVR